MKNLNVCWTVILLFSKVIILEAQINLLTNSEMEVWSGGIPSDWDYSGSSYIQESSSPIHSGSKSAEITVPTTTTTAELSQDISINSDDICTFSCWVNDNTVIGEIGLIINWRNAGGSLGWTNSGHSVDSGVWQKLSIAEATAPAEATIARVRIRAYKQSDTGGGVVYVDDAQFSTESSLDVTLGSFVVEQTAIGNLLKWRTESEVGTAGFNVFKSVNKEGPYQQLNHILITSQGNQSTGNQYDFVDTDFNGENPVWYRLEEMTMTQQRILLGTIPVFPTQESDLPVNSRLICTAPNPLNPSTWISFEISSEEAGIYALDIYNILGRKVITLANQFFQPGQYRYFWSGCDQHGVPVSSGIYITHLGSEIGVLDMKKMVKCK